MVRGPALACRGHHGSSRGAGGARAPKAGQMTPGASAGRFRHVRAPGEQMRFHLRGAWPRGTPGRPRGRLPCPLVPPRPAPQPR